MTTFLFNSIPLSAGADRMAQVDPHGWTLTLISVSVVFCALIILYFVYSLSGGFFSGKIKTPKIKKSSSLPDEETAVAIALALEEERDGGAEGERAAAIATALHLCLSESVHDVESGVITIKRENSPWGNKERNFRKLPTR